MYNDILEPRSNFTSVAIHLKPYVGCSQATNSSGLHLTGKFPAHLPNMINNDSVQVEMNNLQSGKKLITHFYNLMGRKKFIKYYLLQRLKPSCTCRRHT